MDEFRMDNTEGYSQSQLDKLNAEWVELVEEMNLEPGTDEYDLKCKWFSDEVAKR